MKMVVCDPQDTKGLIAKRRASGADRFDEVWDGVYVMSPIADNEHQGLGTAFSSVLYMIVAGLGLGDVFAGVNVSDRLLRWKRNYRCPDLAVFLRGCKARNRGTFWFGGPDFAAEIVSKRDRSRKKLKFYAKVGTRELLIVDRYPWALELYVLRDGELEVSGRSTLDDPQSLQSTVLPVAFRLVAGTDRPQIEVAQPGRPAPWRV